MRVVITGAHRFERGVTFAFDEDVALIAGSECGRRWNSSPAGQIDGGKVLDFMSMRIAMPAVAIVIVAGLLYMLLPGVAESPWTISRLIGAVLALVGYVLVCTARVQLGRAFAVQPKARFLVTHGLYSRVRNPLYVFVDLMIVGLLLVLNLGWLLPVVAILIAVQTFQARREARVLRNAFGDAYDEYRRGTWF